MYALNATLLKLSGGASARNFDAGITLNVHYSGVGPGLMALAELWGINLWAMEF